MQERVFMTNPFERDNPIQRWWKSRDFLQQRMIRMCLSILVMVICFPLYYLGLFGGVEGPLSPACIGAHLSNLGVTRTHALLVFLSLLVITAAWNWIFNLVSMAMGSRLTCMRVNSSKTPCGAPVRRVRDAGPDGSKRVGYVCEQGHRRPEAHFHPVRKGPISHCLWLLSLVFCLIIVFTS